jgi:hypothetical protein
VKGMKRLLFSSDHICRLTPWGLDYKTFYDRNK